MSLYRRLGRSIARWAALLLALLSPALLPPHLAGASDGAPTAANVRAEAGRGKYLLIDFKQLRSRLEHEPGRILLVDTRQDWEFRTGHIPNSINFSFEPTRWSRLTNRWALAKALGEDTSRPIVFY